MISSYTSIVQTVTQTILACHIVVCRGGKIHKLGLVTAQVTIILTKPDRSTFDD